MKKMILMLTLAMILTLSFVSASEIYIDRATNRPVIGYKGLENDLGKIAALEDCGFSYKDNIIRYEVDSAGYSLANYDDCIFKETSGSFLALMKKFRDVHLEYKKEESSFNIPTTYAGKNNILDFKDSSETFNFPGGGTKPIPPTIVGGYFECNGGTIECDIGGIISELTNSKIKAKNVGILLPGRNTKDESANFRSTNQRTIIFLSGDSYILSDAGVKITAAKGTKVTFKMESSNKQYIIEGSYNYNGESRKGASELFGSGYGFVIPNADSIGGSYVSWVNVKENGNDYFVLSNYPNFDSSGEENGVKISPINPPTDNEVAFVTNQILSFLEGKITTKPSFNARSTIIEGVKTKALIGTTQQECLNFIRTA